MLAVKTILHPTDFSERSAWAFRVACALARDCGARVLVLHVAPPPRTLAEAMAHRDPEVYRDPLWYQLRHLPTPDATIPAAYWLEEGDPATQILNVAREWPRELIVMGTHGRTGISRLLTGRVAEAVLRDATCPVLTVRTPVPDETRSPAATEGEPLQDREHAEEIIAEP